MNEKDLSRSHAPWILAVSLAALSGCRSNRESSADVSGREASVASPSSSSTSGAPARSTYGAAIVGTTMSPLTDVLREPDPFVGKTLLVEGEVRKACSRKGCWMELATAVDPGAPGLRVTFLDYGFFVPTNAAGSHARVEGKIEVKDVSKAHVDHLESEGATFSNKLPDGSAKEVRFIATGVELSRG